MFFLHFMGDGCAARCQCVVKGTTHRLSPGCHHNRGPGYDYSSIRRTRSIRCAVKAETTLDTCAV